MRVLITGANGFVGKSLVKDFAASGYLVTAASRNEPTELPEDVKWIAAPSLELGADFSALVCDCDIVVHAAARVHVMKDTAHDSLKEFRAANVEGTLALARAAIASGIRHFVFLSSVKVNGEETRKGQCFNRTDIPDPQDAYAISKAEAERELVKLSNETCMKITIIRPVLVYGPGVKGNFRILMDVMARGIPLPLGGIDNKRSLVYVRNLTNLVVKVANHPNAFGKIIFASDGVDLSTSSLLQLIGQSLNRKASLLPIPRLVQRLAILVVRKNSAARRLLCSLQVDHQAACDTIDWSPPYSVAEGIAETAADYLISLRREHS